jgi:hypothetical protein
MEKTEVQEKPSEQSQEMKEPIREWLPPSDNSAIQKQYQKFKVVRPFFMKVRNGPAIAVKVGEVVELATPSFITDMFCAGKIEPIEPGIPEEGEYSAVKSFQATIDGLFKEIRLLDILELTKEEAIPLLKLRKIKPMDDKFFSLP